MIEPLAVLVLIGTVWVSLGVLSLMDRLRRNPIAGVRIAGAMTSDASWRMVQRAAAPLMIGTGAVGLLLAIWVWIESLSNEQVADPDALLAGYIALVLVMGIVIIVVSHRALRKSHRSDDPSVAPWNR